MGLEVTRMDFGSLDLNPNYDFSISSSVKQGYVHIPNPLVNS